MTDSLYGMTPDRSEDFGLALGTFLLTALFIVLWALLLMLRPEQPDAVQLAAAQEPLSCMACGHYEAQDCTTGAACGGDTNRCAYGLVCPPGASAACTPRR